MPDSTTRGPVSGDLGRGTPEVQKYRPRACQSCARSKMRCVWPSEPGATPCQRCSKIQSPCTLPEINPRRRRGPSTRVGQLEEKIDGIMSLLNASQQIQQNSPSSSGQTPPSTSSAAPPFEQGGGRGSIQQLLNPNVESASSSSGAGSGSSSRPAEASRSFSTPPPPPPSSANFHSQARLVPPAGLAAADMDSSSHDLAPERAAMHTPAGGESVEIVKGFRVTFFEADRALNLYRSLYSPYFPFVPIPAMMPACELHDRSPFLFRAVVAVTTPQSPAVQAEYHLWFRQYVAQHVVVNNEKRLEILQAILIHLAWGDFYFTIDSQATNLIQLANSLVIDLGLNRWPLDYGRASLLMMKEAAISSAGKLPWKKQHTLDEMRASLGTFYITSLCSTLFRRHQPFMYNSYLSKCCETLADAQEYDSDKFLLATVKIQQLLNRGADIIPYSGEEATHRVQYTPAHMALSSIQKELEVLLREQPPEVECNALLWTHYHATLCRLFEPVIYIRSASPGGGGGYEADESEGPTRTAALWQCLHSARDFFGAFLAIPPQHFACMPFQSAHLSFCVLTATRLLFLGDDGSPGPSARDPDWSPWLARDAVRLDAIYARLADLFGDADRICAGLGRRVRHLSHERSVLAGNRDRIRWMRSWYVDRTKSSSSSSSSSLSSSFPGYPAAGAEDDGGQQQERERGAAGGGGGGGAASAKDGIRNHPMGSGGGDMLRSGGSSVPAAHGGHQPMDIDYGGVQLSVQQAAAMPVPELDDVFWQAMLDWGWNGGMDLTMVQV